MSAQTAETKFVQANGTRYAYRTVGDDRASPPLVLLQDLITTMDGWDPMVVDGLARGRKLVLFDNAGVGFSSGSTPSTVGQMAMDAVDFVAALGLEQVDLLGYSLGGMVAQHFTANWPDTVGKSILVGTAPRGGQHRLVEFLEAVDTDRGLAHPRIDLFFTKSDASQAAGRRYIERIGRRSEDRDMDVHAETARAQAQAFIDWCATDDPDNRILGAIDHPVLIVSGSHDTILPADNSYALFKRLPNAQLILYPDSGHGSVFQYPDRFVAQATLFLSEPAKYTSTA